MLKGVALAILVLLAFGLKLAQAQCGQSRQALINWLWLILAAAFMLCLLA
jgi:hypothetical protein